MVVAIAAAITAAKAAAPVVARRPDAGVEECRQPLAHVLPVVAADTFVGDGVSHLLEPRLQLGTPFGRVEDAGDGFARPDHVGKWARRREHGIEGRPALVAHQIVRILALGQQRETHRPPGPQPRQRQVDGAVGRPAAGRSVEAQDRLGRHAPEELSWLSVNAVPSGATACSIPAWASAITSM